MEHDRGASDVREVTELSDRYEAALVANDLDAMNAMFWDDPHALRFGIADMQHGYDEIVAWRSTAAPVSPLRTVTERQVLALAPGVVAVDIVFVDGDQAMVGRQSQTWVRQHGRWRIVRAHVSVVAG